jgi:hypothetical protein
MAKGSPTWRKQVLEALALIALHRSSTSTYTTVHFVQRLQQDPDFRRQAIADALQRAQPREGDKTGTTEYQRVQAAADRLRKFDGHRI